MAADNNIPDNDLSEAGNKPQPGAASVHDKTNTDIFVAIGNAANWSETVNIFLKESWILEVNWLYAIASWDEVLAKDVATKFCKLQFLMWQARLKWLEWADSSIHFTQEFMVRQAEYYEEEIKELRDKEWEQGLRGDARTKFLYTQETAIRIQRNDNVKTAARLKMIESLPLEEIMANKWLIPIPNLHSSEDNISLSRCVNMLLMSAKGYVEEHIQSVASVLLRRLKTNVEDCVIYNEGKPDKWLVDIVKLFLEKIPDTMECKSKIKEQFDAIMGASSVAT
jgi:hypothetical protein